MHHDTRLPHLTVRQLKWRRIGAIVATLSIVSLIGSIALEGARPQATEVIAVDRSVQPNASTEQAASAVAAGSFPADCSQMPGNAVDCLYY